MTTEILRYGRCVKIEYINLAKKTLLEKEYATKLVTIDVRTDHYQLDSIKHLTSTPMSCI